MTVRIEVSKAAGSGRMWKALADLPAKTELTNDLAKDAARRQREAPSSSRLTNVSHNPAREVHHKLRLFNPLTFQPLSTLLDLLAYGAIAGLAHSVHFYGRYRERQQRALFLLRRLSLEWLLLAETRHAMRQFHGD